MKSLRLITTVCLVLFGSLSTALADNADIYSVRFSDDGRYLITGGTGGEAGLKDGMRFLGGIKVWDASNGKFIEGFGKQSHLDTVFGNNHRRMSTRRWAISSFQDIVLNGSYPDGKIVMLPSSLSRVDQQTGLHVPSIIGGYMDFDDRSAQKIRLQGSVEQGNSCANIPGADDYIGPVVASDNGRYAAVVINTCTARALSSSAGTPQGFGYKSSLQVLDLTTLKVIHAQDRIDAGVYALGISNNGQRVAFVGSERFAVLDLPDSEIHVVEDYGKGQVFIVPRQFSTLHFSSDGGKLVSLKFIFDIDSGVETTLPWTLTDKAPQGRISNVKVSPDMSYFVLTQPKRSVLVFDDDGLPQPFGAADRVVILDATTGAKTPVEITDSLTSGKGCVTAISPNSQKLAVACKGGLIKVFNSRDGQQLWSRHNVGAKAREIPPHLKQVLNSTAPPALLSRQDGLLPWQTDKSASLSLAQH